MCIFIIIIIINHAVAGEASVAVEVIVAISITQPVG